MQINSVKENKSYSIKFTAREGDQVLGSLYLYIMFNDLHNEPFGFIENLFVKEESRGKGTGSALIKEVIEEAKKLKCYKIICTSRNSKPEVHELYLKLGFKDHGKEFRINLI